MYLSNYRRCNGPVNILWPGMTLMGGISQCISQLAGK